LIRTPLKRARLQAGLSAIQLADIASTTENRLYQLERGRFRPRPAEAAGLAAALNQELSKLFPSGVQEQGARCVE